MSNLNDSHGNFYKLTHTASGIATFLHNLTGETLHGQVGPYEEAWSLYVASSGLLSHVGPAVVFDLGMGCATQVIACLDAVAENRNLSTLRIVSFDLEKKGLDALKSHLGHFPFARPHEEFLNEMCEKNEILIELPSGQKIHWQFVGGDYCQTIQAEPGKYGFADYLFYDFFSAANLPELWTIDVLENTFKHTSPSAVLITYSSATCTRAVMAAAGFYVGLGIVSGKKMQSTVAARKLDMLAQPLPKKWQNTFYNSHKAFNSGETEAGKIRITEGIKNHPQFTENNENE